ncbi:MAG TPA: O-antigen ligase family protein [Acidimicrobiales bacterium]|nr:O-antigen ligase family protein [Acidimicrobiales bacterium]
MPAAVATRRARVWHIDRATTGAWVLFLAIAALAAAVGLDHLYAWTGTPERHFGWLTWLLCAAAFAVGQNAAEDGRRVVSITAAIAAAAIGAWSIAELLGWEPVRLVAAGSRPVGPFGSSAFLGAAAALLGPVAVGFAMQRRRPIAVAAAALSGVALVASGARAAWVGVLVAAVIAAVLRRAVNRRVMVGAAAIALIAVGGAFAFGVAGRVPALFTDRDGGVHGRLDEWRVATRVVLARPLTGVGPEGYRIAFARHVDDRYEARHGRDPLPDRAHDAFLDVAATTGLLGLAAYVLLLGLAGRLIVRAARRGDPLTAGIAVGVMGYAVQSLFLFPLAELDPLAWLLAGVVAASMSERRVAIAAGPPVRVVAAVFATVALIAGGLDLVADRDARATLAALADQRLPGGDRPRQLRPDQLRYHLLAARAAEARGTPSGLNAALADVARGLAVSPRDPVGRAERARILLERARLTGNRRHVAAATAALTALVHSDPRNAEAWLRLGLADALAGDQSGARRAWKIAERLAPRSPAASIDLAVSYAGTNEWPAARAAARRALRRDPGNRQAEEILHRADGTG